MTTVFNSVRAGPVSVSDGAFPNFRGDKTGGLVISAGHGKWHEAASRALLFSAQTAPTGVAPGTALGTTAAYCLHNPTGSGHVLSVLSLGMGYISGTLGAGTVHICSSSPGDAVPTGTAITPRNRSVGSTAASVATPLTTATITTNAGKAIDQLCSLTALVAATAVAPWAVEKDVGGAIVIQPGYNITLHATAAAGTTPLVVFNALWQEIPIPS